MEACVYVLKIKKTQGMDRVEVLRQPPEDSGCSQLPRWFYRWVEVEPTGSEIRAKVYQEMDRKGYVVVEVHSWWFGYTEGGRAFYIRNPHIVE